ncbi:MAG: NAD(P)-dependent oxidoreductase [Proteobacteria bacterium]|nr:NAD(P)-dependent oxidoreductase [Pseudomonadota bacterium]NOG59085.1 NAD(P)-dependent oxidoreductase [Pseudomonadota bacterium]
MDLKKKVLVTGSSGFIGSAVVETLTDNGWIVTTTTRHSKRLKSGSCVFLDLSDINSIVNLDKNQHFDAIVHLGAHIGWSGQSSKELFIPNVVATGILAEFSAKIDAKFVFASASIVHGIKTEEITQDTVLNPDTPYGKSKWLAEELIAVSGTRNCRLRIGGVFGQNGPAHLGLNRAIANAINKIPPQLIGAGDALRNYIYVNDVATAISYILDNDIDGVHLLAGTEVNSIAAMLQQICDVFIPGQSPIVIEEAEANNQVVSPSDILPDTRNIKDALMDIHKNLSL